MESLCSFCNERPVKNDSDGCCNNSKCLSFAEDLYNSILEAHREELKKAKKNLFTKSSYKQLRTELYSRRSAIFHLIKARLCFLFGWFLTDDSYEYVDLCYWDVGPAIGEYGGQSWMTLSVGYGVFKNWYIHIYPDESY